ncbi:MAG: beta-galactosidase GalA [Verrucomicrobiota bacterium]|jgi:beta-galactosidase
MISVIPRVWRLAVAGPMIALCLAGRSAQAAATNDSPRQRLLMDLGWKFQLGDNWGTGERLDKAGQSTGPASPNFNDLAWRPVNLPHDWAVELPFDAKADASHGFKPVGPGFPGNSVGWYRRSFPLPAEDKDKRLWLELDGAFRDCRIFLNGYLIGHFESGYNTFRYDITDVANYGGRNVLAVRVDASQTEGWFYEGAGIYRHVWLIKTSPLAIAEDGTFVYAQFPNNLPQGPATIQIETQIRNSQNKSADATVQCRILDPDGKEVASTAQTAAFGAFSLQTLMQSAQAAAPRLWSPETPRLYKLVTTVTCGGVTVDRTETEFGIRTLVFDADKGFLLNGQPYEIKGTCNHQDHAGVGAALPDALQYYRIARLKEMGGNAVRTAHNPPTAELLEACDRLGMLVMDENRLLGSDSRNLGRLERLVRRDRNHPSIFIWSLANEETEEASATAGRITTTMQELVHRLDPARQCTCACDMGNVFTGMNQVIDVRGWNYHFNEADSYHRDHPTQPNIGTEQGSTVSTRGIYTNDKTLGYVSAYDENTQPWSSTAEAWWTYFAARPWLSGGFVWTGFDYRGEPTPYGWPCVNSHFGVMDTCGFAKDNFYYYQACWSDRPVVHLLPHWNWSGKEGQDIDVRCYSNCEEVELLLNGQSLGRKPMPKNSHLQWMVQYAPGALAARGYKGGRQVAEDKVQTTGAPAAVGLYTDDRGRSGVKADGEDLSIITVAVQDAQGRTVPVSENLIKFEISGPGKIIGVGNGDPSSHEPDVYPAIPHRHTVDVTDWRFERVENTTDAGARPEVGEKFDDSSWKKGDVTTEAGPLQPHESAIYRTRFVGSRDMLDSESILLNFGMIDDEGWVYVNGRFVGESHDWAAQPSFEVRKELHAGTNTVVVAVKNNEGSGGVNKGVTLSIADKLPPPQWQRHVFNGLAQVIVQAGTEPGKIQLTARSEGLATALLDIAAQPSPPRPAAP